MTGKEMLGYLKECYEEAELLDLEVSMWDITDFLAEAGILDASDINTYLSRKESYAERTLKDALE